MLGSIHHHSSPYSPPPGTPSHHAGRLPPPPLSSLRAPSEHDYHRHYSTSSDNSSTTTTSTTSSPQSSLPLTTASAAGSTLPSPIFPDHRHAASYQQSDPSYYGRSPTGRPSGCYAWGYSSPPSAAATGMRPLEFAAGGSKHLGARSAGGALAAGKPPPSSPCYGSPPPGLLARPKLTTTAWEDEGTLCYQVDAKGICVARRDDNQMINGTKLLNVVGMSRGKRDGILKNERGRVVIKVGAMHLKGVWISLHRAKFLANKFRIGDLLYPLFEDDPRKFVHPASPVAGRPPSIFDTTAADPSASSPIGKRSSLPSILDSAAASRSLSPLHADPKYDHHPNRPSPSILPLPRALQQPSYPCLNYNYHEQRQPMPKTHDAAAAPPPPPPPPRALPYPAGVYQEQPQRPPVDDLSHQTKNCSQELLRSGSLPERPAQPSACGNERERRSHGDA